MMVKHGGLMMVDKQQEQNEYDLEKCLDSCVNNDQDWQYGEPKCLRNLLIQYDPCVDMDLLLMVSGST